MATNVTQQAFAPVLEALATMSASVDRAQKGEAHQFLENFQKSVSNHPTASKPRTNQSIARCLDDYLFNPTLR